MNNNLLLRKKPRIVRRFSTNWKTEKLYFDNDDYYRDLIAEIDLARYSIEMEVFTFEEGVLGQRIIEAFHRATLRGVSVRLICDGWGSPLFLQNIAPLLRRIGVRYKLYRPLPWRFGHTRGESKNIFFKLWSRIKKINRGFHRKVTIIDKKYAWVGSLNVSDVHLKEVYGKNAWVDVGARIEGEALPSLNLAFEKAFNKKRWLRLRPRPNHPLVLLNDSFVRRRRTTYIQKRRLRRAKKRIWIQNPYFVPERSLLQALYKAAKRGVDVKVLVPDKNDQPIVKWIMHALLNQLLNHNIQVYEYKLHFAHKKVLIADSTYTIGSTNFNHRSILHDQEVEILVTHRENQRLLDQVFRADLENSVLITKETINLQAMWYRIFIRLMFFLRYWC